MRMRPTGKISAPTSGWFGLHRAGDGKARRRGEDAAGKAAANDQVDRRQSELAAPGIDHGGGDVGRLHVVHVPAPVARGRRDAFAKPSADQGSLLLQSSKSRASVILLITRQYLLQRRACRALRQHRSKSWAEFGGPRFHRHPTAELPTRQAPRGFPARRRQPHFRLFHPVNGATFFGHRATKRRWVAARGRSCMLAEIDRFCGQIAADIQGSEMQLTRLSLTCR